MQDRITPEHEAYFRKVFEEFDVNGDQEMTREEVCMLMGALGEKLSDTKIDELISQIHSDGNGVVDCEQFLHLMHIIMKKADTGKEFRSLFKIFDRDGNGSVSASELDQVMTNLERTLTASELEEIYKNVNRAGKEEIDEEEFVKLLMQSYD